MARKNNSQIGGQAVIEGVMMRGPGSMATAVRTDDGKIAVESERFKPFKDRSVFYRIPVIRGVLNFVSSMVSGLKTLNRASELYSGMENEQPGKFEKWLAKKFNIDIMSVVIGISFIIGIMLAVGLFIFLPHFITDGIVKLVDKPVKNIYVNLIAGVIRIIIFVTYVLLISLMKDIKRLFRYHGAEHKVISCYEFGYEMTVENAQKMTTVHDRCGTTFMFIVMVFSILFFSLDVFSQNVWQRVLIRIVFLPVVAGISYEILKVLAKFDNPFTRICRMPGLLLQKLTTKEPDDAMVEVALKAFLTVLDLEADPAKETESFVTFSTVEKTIKELCGIVSEEHEAELIVMFVTGAKTKSELYDGRRISSVQKKKAADYAKRRVKGAPLQYVLGEACFYGLDFTVDQSVLIPRFDTEILVKEAIDIASGYDNPAMLDLMTGSGAIAVAVKKNVSCTMTATDISPEAVSLAKLNSDKNGCEINFTAGSLFKPVKDAKFDIICCNPPYIPTRDISKLDEEVRSYEPHSALDGGFDGLEFYRDIAEGAAEHLNENGTLILEAGIGQAADIAKLLEKEFDIRFAYDMNNPPVARVVIAVKKAVADGKDSEQPIE